MRPVISARSSRATLLGLRVMSPSRSVSSVSTTSRTRSTGCCRGSWTTPQDPLQEVPRSSPPAQEVIPPRASQRLVVQNSLTADSRLPRASMLRQRTLSPTASLFQQLVSIGEKLDSCYHADFVYFFHHPFFVYLWAVTSNSSRMNTPHRQAQKGHSP